MKIPYKQKVLLHQNRKIAEILHNTDENSFGGCYIELFNSGQIKKE